MDNTSNIALSRMIAQSRAVEITANNIANVSTPGFQAERIVFSDWMVRQHGAEAPRGGETLMFTQDRATYRDQTQGTFTHTGNPWTWRSAAMAIFRCKPPTACALRAPAGLPSMPPVPSLMEWAMR